MVGFCSLNVVIAALLALHCCLESLLRIYRESYCWTQGPSNTASKSQTADKGKGPAVDTGKGAAIDKGKGSALDKGKGSASAVDKGKGSIAEAAPAHAVAQSNVQGAKR